MNKKNKTRGLYLNNPYHLRTHYQDQGLEKIFTQLGGLQRACHVFNYIQNINLFTGKQTFNKRVT